MAAHKLEKHVRTRDVLASENLSFKDLHLTAHVLRGLTKAGFEKPSPIQLKAIPLGRCGLDLIVQAKSGTGKTCVFSVIALDGIITESPSAQVLVLAPTREIAVQIQQVVEAIGAGLDGLRCYTFIGGMPLKEDIANLARCHIAIGTPGRIKQLIDEGHLSVDSIRLFVLDEADKLMDGDFQETINWIYSSLPGNKQMLALSATYPEVLAQHLTAYMRNPTFIRLNATDPALLGIRQYYVNTPFERLPQKVNEAKLRKLVDILSAVQFNQCLVFSNYQMRAQSLCDSLTAEGWPTEHISGAREQPDRLEAMRQLKQYQCRVLVSTDLTARGIDAEHVNLVINLDIPAEHETYLHRIGRAGRFGTYGAGISIVGSEKDKKLLDEIQEKCNTSVKPLPDPIPADLASSSGFVYYDDFITTEQINTDAPSSESLAERSTTDHQTSESENADPNNASCDKTDKKTSDVANESHAGAARGTAPLSNSTTEQAEISAKNKPFITASGTPIQRKSVKVVGCADAMSDIRLSEIDKSTMNGKPFITASGTPIPRKSVKVKGCADAMSNIELSDINKSNDEKQDNSDQNAISLPSPEVSSNQNDCEAEKLNKDQQNKPASDVQSNETASNNSRRKRPVASSKTESAKTLDDFVKANEAASGDSAISKSNGASASGDSNPSGVTQPIADRDNRDSGDSSATNGASSRPRARGRRKKKLHPWGDWLMTDEKEIEASARSRENRQRVSHDVADAIFDDVVTNELNEMDQKVKTSPEGSYFKVARRPSSEETEKGSKASKVKSPTFARSKTDYQARSVVSYDDLLDSGASSGHDGMDQPIGMKGDHTYAVPTSPTSRAMPKHLTQSRSLQSDISKELTHEEGAAGFTQGSLNMLSPRSDGETSKRNVMRRKERQVVTYDDDLFDTVADDSVPESSTTLKPEEKGASSSLRIKPRENNDANTESTVERAQVVKSKTQNARPDSMPTKSRAKSKNIWAMPDDTEEDHNEHTPKHRDAPEQPRDFNPRNRSAVAYDDMDMFSVTPPTKKDKKKKKKKDRNEDEAATPKQSVPESKSEGAISSFGVGIFRNKSASVKKDKAEAIKKEKPTKEAKAEPPGDSYTVSGVAIDNKEIKLVLKRDVDKTPRGKENKIGTQETENGQTNTEKVDDSHARLNDPEPKTEKQDIKPSQDVNSKKYKLLSRYNESKSEKINQDSASKPKKQEVSVEEYTKSKAQLANLLNGGVRPKSKRMGYAAALQDLTNYKQTHSVTAHVNQVTQDNLTESLDIMQKKSGGMTASRDIDKGLDDSAKVAPIHVEDLAASEQEKQRRKDIASCVSVLQEKLELDIQSLMDACESDDYSPRGTVSQENGSGDAQPISVSRSKEHYSNQASAAPSQRNKIITDNISASEGDSSNVGAVGGALPEAPNEQLQKDAQIVRPKVRPPKPPASNAHQKPKKGANKPTAPSAQSRDQPQHLRKARSDYVQSSSTDGYSSDFDSESILESLSDSGAGDSSDRGDYSIDDVAEGGDMGQKRVCDTCDVTIQDSPDVRTDKPACAAASKEADKKKPKNATDVHDSLDSNQMKMKTGDLGLEGICESCIEIAEEIAEEYEVEEEEEEIDEEISDESGSSANSVDDSEGTSDESSEEEESEEEESDTEDEEDEEHECDHGISRHPRDHRTGRRIPIYRDPPHQHNQHRYKEKLQEEPYIPRHPSKRMKDPNGSRDTSGINCHQHKAKGNMHQNYEDHACPHHQQYEVTDESNGNTSEDSHFTYTCEKHRAYRYDNEYDESLPRPDSVQSDYAHYKYNDRPTDFYDGYRPGAFSTHSDACYQRRHRSQYRDTHSNAESAMCYHYYGNGFYGSHDEIQNAAQMFTHYQQLYWQQMAHNAQPHHHSIPPPNVSYPPNIYSPHLPNPYQPNPMPYTHPWNHPAIPPISHDFRSNSQWGVPPPFPQPELQRTTSYEALEANHRQLQDRHRGWAEYYRKLHEREKRQAALERESRAQQEYIRDMTTRQRKHKAEY